MNQDDIKAILDIATHSMDWSSGFLDHEEVGTLRRVAEQVGVDPIEVTPFEWRRQYAHEFKVGAPGSYHQAKGLCDWGCDRPESDPVHHGQDNMGATPPRYGPDA